MEDPLYRKSIEIILSNQHPSGSFPASPSFPRFRYCWLRDGVYTAHAVLMAGHTDIAKRFYHWCNQAILPCRDIVERLHQKLLQKETLAEEDFMPARFTMDGLIEEKAESSEIPFYYEKWPEIYSLENITGGNTWPNFQTDCYGAWLWGLSAYVEQTGDYSMLEESNPCIDMVLDYLRMTWEMPCFDPWEEYGQKRAISTMGSIAGGLMGINRFRNDPSLEQWINEIRRTLMQTAVPEGYLPKFIGTDQVDSSVLWLFVPMKVFEADSVLAKACVKKVEEDLHTGGVKRYKDDLYYGGGEWIIMTCWLAWYYLEAGRPEKAYPLLDWCAAHTEDGEMFAEQVLDHLNHPEALEDWMTKWWNASPAPLLWAHAMYVIVRLVAYHCPSKC